MTGIRFWKNGLREVVFKKRSGVQPIVMLCTSNTSVPNAHQSTPFPCPLFSKISGAKYSGVPQKVFVPPSAPEPAHSECIIEMYC